MDSGILRKNLYVCAASIVLAFMSQPSHSEQLDKTTAEKQTVPGYDIRSELVKKGEIKVPYAPRSGFNASNIPEASLEAARNLAAMPGKEYIKSFSILWGPRNIPKSLFNDERPLSNPDNRKPVVISKVS